MGKASDHEFWRRQFEIGGNHSGLWWDSAYSLLTAADVLDDFIGDLRGEIQSDRPMTQQSWNRMSVEKVSYMLCAMATECLLKALWLKYGGRLTEDGKYGGVLEKKKNEHQLHELANAVSEKGHIRFTTSELKLLELASYWIISGRYPVHKDYQNHIPRQSWRGHPLQELRLLIDKLQRELGFKINFT